MGRDKGMHIETEMSGPLRPIAQARRRQPVLVDRKGLDGGEFGEATFLRGLDEMDGVW